MAELAETVDDFLSQKRIAVTGVSRSGGAPANLIYRKLRDAGYEVHPVNPQATEVEGATCYPDLRSLPQRPDGVVIATHPDAALEIVGECARLGVERVWMHRSFGQGSVSDRAVAYCREHGVRCIPGACPMMYLEPDIGHRCMRWILGVTGKLPQPH